MICRLTYLILIELIDFNDDFFSRSLVQNLSSRNSFFKIALIWARFLDLQWDVITGYCRLKCPRSSIPLTVFIVNNASLWMGCVAWIIDVKMNGRINIIPFFYSSFPPSITLEKASLNPQRIKFIKSNIHLYHDNVLVTIALFKQLL